LSACSRPRFARIAVFQSATMTFGRVEATRARVAFDSSIHVDFGL